MPRFYFHLYDDMEVFDEEGQEFADFESALAEALLTVRRMAADEIVRAGQVVTTHRIDIADSDGRVLDTLHFGEAVVLAAGKGRSGAVSERPAVRQQR